MNEQTKKNNYLKLERYYDNLLRKLGYIIPKWKKEITLSNGLKVKSRRLKVVSVNKCDKVIAFDTETYKGTCRLLANSDSLHTEVNPSFDDCIRFLFYNANNPRTFRFFYNIDFDISAIIKLWNSKNMFHRLRLEWLKNGITIKYVSRGHKKRVIYEFTWFKSRMFILKHTSRDKRVVFTDIFNFFLTGLGKASLEYLDDFKIDDIDGNLLNTSLDYWKERLNDIIKYCIQDCIITEKLGKLLVETLDKHKIPLPRYLVSPASLSKQDFRKNCYIPTITCIPKEVLEIGFKTYSGARFEMLRKGFFKEVYLYDINSQYPSLIKDLPNLRNGLWKKLSFPNTLYIPKREILAFYLVEFDIPKDYKIPTIPIKHNGVNKFIVGKIKKWCTWYDLDLMRDFIVKVYSGYRFFQSNKRKPFEKRINELYEQKKELKNKFELGYNLTKLDMNALSGCFIEKHKNYNRDGSYELVSGILFNSVYASQILAFGRWSVIKNIPRDKYDNIIAIHTDSIISDIPLEKYLIIDDKIGNWNKESKENDKGIILNTGMYQVGYIVKTRGIPKKYIKNWLRFCLKYGIYKKKTMKITHMKKLSEGLIQDKSLINVNTMDIIDKSVNCNSDTKRDWINDITSFKDLISRNIESYPLICHYNIKELKTNPICLAHRYEIEN